MNRVFIKYGVLLLLLMLLPVSVSAQKDVRKSVRKGNKEYSQQNYPEATILYEKALSGNASSKEAVLISLTHFISRKSGINPSSNTIILLRWNRKIRLRLQQHGII